MGIDRLPGSPAFHDQINALKEGEIDIVESSQVFEQAHPECGECLVIKTRCAMMAGEVLYRMAHSDERLCRRHFGQIAERHSDVSRVSELGSRHVGVLKSVDKRRHLIVVLEIARLQDGKFVRGSLTSSR